MKAKKGNIFIRIGLLLIAAAFFIAVYNIFADYRAGQKSDEALKSLKTGIETAAIDSINDDTADGVPLYKKYPDMDMPLVNIDGEYYVGILSIPTLDIELPVKGEFSYGSLRNSPCRYDGSVYLDNMIIAAHNYKRHFGRLKNINIGDKVSFTDGDGNAFLYSVSDVIQVEGTDIEGMKGGQWDMTLFTCTLSGQERIAVRLKREANTQY